MSNLGRVNITEILLLVMGVILIGLGISIWKNERIDYFNENEIDIVSYSNRKDFCKLSGIGVMCTGFGFCAAVVLLLVSSSAYSFIALAVGVIVGVIMLSGAKEKYKK